MPPTDTSPTAGRKRAVSQVYRSSKEGGNEASTQDVSLSPEYIQGVYRLFGHLTKGYVSKKEPTGNPEETPESTVDLPLKWDGAPLWLDPGIYSGETNDGVIKVEVRHRLLIRNDVLYFACENIGGGDNAVVYKTAVVPYPDLSKEGAGLKGDVKYIAARIPFGLGGILVDLSEVKDACHTNKFEITKEVIQPEVRHRVNTLSTASVDDENFNTYFPVSGALAPGETQLSRLAECDLSQHSISTVVDTLAALEMMNHLGNRHQKTGKIHRDIKPENILVYGKGNPRTYRIVDREAELEADLTCYDGERTHGVGGLAPNVAETRRYLDPRITKIIPLEAEGVKARGDVPYAYSSDVHSLATSIESAIDWDALKEEDDEKAARLKRLLSMAKVAGQPLAPGLGAVPIYLMSRMIALGSADAVLKEQSSAFELSSDYLQLLENLLDETDSTAQRTMIAIYRAIEEKYFDEGVPVPWSVWTAFLTRYDTVIQLSKESGQTSDSIVKFLEQERRSAQATIEGCFLTLAQAQGELSTSDELILGCLNKYPQLDELVDEMPRRSYQAAQWAQFFSLLGNSEEEANEVVNILKSNSGLLDVMLRNESLLQYLVSVKTGDVLTNNSSEGETGLGVPVKLVDALKVISKKCEVLKGINSAREAYFRHAQGKKRGNETNQTVQETLDRKQREVFHGWVGSSSSLDNAMSDVRSSGEDRSFRRSVSMAAHRSSDDELKDDNTRLIEAFRAVRRCSYSSSLGNVLGAVFTAGIWWAMKAINAFIQDTCFSVPVEIEDLKTKHCHSRMSHLLHGYIDAVKKAGVDVQQSPG